ncbi:UNVERIFIED_CONTAM: hypothetical protein Sradi_0732600 [Sesamum radiatum]|uniref:Uncharacterized protein n=1 Tax=Sesamum radiatum TaxID=300843 RepID=A0AAW2VT82_SESRA
MKLWWQFRLRSSLWLEFLHGRYCRNLHPTLVPYNRNHSSVWHRLCHIQDVAEPFVFWTLGHGSVSFWHALAQIGEWSSWHVWLKNMIVHRRSQFTLWTVAYAIWISAGQENKIV